MQKYAKATANMWWNKELVSDEWLGKRLNNNLTGKASGKDKE